ncbi:MAG: hypothetical protein NTY00_03670 [Deltaproteobacteria bacterium]|nr:hypothetical protein [Deltaproteobacteria bacterium]
MIFCDQWVGWSGQNLFPDPRILSPLRISCPCRRYTRLTEIKKRISFNAETVAFLSKPASSFGLDNMDGQGLIEALPVPVFFKNRERVLIPAKNGRRLLVRPARRSASAGSLLPVIMKVNLLLSWMVVLPAMSR